MEHSVSTIVEGIVNAWNERDLEKVSRYLADDVVWDDPAMLTGPAEGLTAVLAFCENVLRAFPDFTFKIREPICVSMSGKRCAIPWEIRATHTGRFDPFGFSPTLQTIVMRGVDLIELRDNKVVRIETTFNILPALEQALRLKPISKRRFVIRLLVLFQKCLALWLRLISKFGK